MEGEETIMIRVIENIGKSILLSKLSKEILTEYINIKIEGII